MFKSVLQKVATYRYEIIAFGVGFCVMVLEIVGARLIAPHLGSSIYVWTAMIGVILGALAVGYWLGGRLADMPGAAEKLHVYLTCAAAIILCLSFIYEPLLSWLSGLSLDLRISSFMAASILFAPPGFFLGCVSPLLAKVRVTSLKQTGHAIGRLEASGTAGSIAGTFLSGYFLLAMFGSHRLVVGLSVFLLVLSFVVAGKQLRLIRAVLLLISFTLLFTPQVRARNLLADIDTSYGRYRVQAATIYGRPGHFLLTDNAGIQSGYSPASPNTMIFPYTQRFMEIADQLKPRRVLMIGGGTHTFASAFVRTQTAATIDVVEIDPALDDLARRYFGLSDSPRLQIIHDDGRRFLNTAVGPYDLIIIDAFIGHTPPFQLVTTEAIQEMRRLLAPDGAVAVNFIARDALSDRYFARFVSSYREVFGNIAVHTASDAQYLPREQRNYILTAAPNAAVLRNAKTGYLTPLPQQTEVFRDDFAPVEQLTQ